MKQTFLQFLAEARRNPEQNPKISINQQIDDYVASDPNDTYISFTSIDKLGINPGSVYNTPLGIYAYPINYVKKVTKDGKSMLELPFAGESEYANLFHARGTIIDLANMQLHEARDYYKKITDLWVELSGEDRKTSVDQVEDIITKASKLAAFPDYVGGRFWYVTMMIAGLLTNKKKKGNAISTIIWNKLFRSIGIDGVVDNGIGIIHSNERYQAVFFSIEAIVDVKRVYNKWSPGHMELKKFLGTASKAMSHDVTQKIRGMSVDEIVQNFIDGELKPYHINYIKSPGVRVALLKKAPWFLNSFSKPTTEEQIIGIQHDRESILRLAKAGVLSNDALVFLITGGTKILAKDAIHWLKQAIEQSNFIASPNLMMALIDGGMGVLETIANKQKIPRNVVEAILEKKRNRRIPSWLRNLSASYNLK
jgi:hypothetical protein